MTRGGEPPDPLLLDRLSAALVHRGPDGAGRLVQRGVGLVHRRLAIIDLETGAQPIRADWGGGLVANAEIYNYVELRAAMPHIPWRTRSDCETVLPLYRTHGLDFPRHLRGMYALALYDPVEDRLILSRDPFGIKPLYYVETTDAFVFASEPGPLVKAGVAPARADPAVRATLLQLQFTTGRDTIFQTVRRLLPGETLMLRHGRIVERRRLDALPAGRPAGPAGEGTALAALDDALDDSLRLHRRADVPCGVFLSGGIDSASLLTVLARQDRPMPRALTVGFDEPGAADERRLARAVAKKCGAPLIETVFTEADFWHLLPKVVAALDDPCADYAALPSYKLARLAREAGIKVVLSGEGGDEIFAGYGRYRGVTRPFWRGGRRMRGRGALDGLGLPQGGLAGWRDGLAAAEEMQRTGGRNALQIAQAVDCENWLPNDLLTRLDRCLMAWGVEGRTPFLDRVVANAGFPLPDHLKIHRNRGKWLLRRWLASQMPDYPAFARKQGFSVPVALWTGRRGKQLGPLVAAHPAFADLFPPGTIARLFQARSRRAGPAAWGLLFFALWYGHHILNQPAEGDVFHNLAAARFA